MINQMKRTPASIVTMLAAFFTFLRCKLKEFLSKSIPCAPPYEDRLV